MMNKWLIRGWLILPLLLVGGLGSVAGVSLQAMESEVSLQAMDSETSLQEETSRVGVPSDLRAEVTGDGVTELSWDEVEGAHGYDVWQSTDSHTWSLAQRITMATHATFRSKSTNLCYFYKVSAWEGTLGIATCGEFTNILCISPKAGNGAVAMEVDCNVLDHAFWVSTAQNHNAIEDAEREEIERPEVSSNITITGSSNQSDTILLTCLVEGGKQDGIRVDQLDAQGNWTEVAQIEGMGQECRIRNLQADATYTFRAMLYRFDLYGNVIKVCDSNEVTVKTLPIPPAPTPVTIPEPAEGTTQSQVAQGYGAEFVEAIYESLNSLRTTLELSTLTVNEDLVAIAQYRANEMASEQYFSHYKDGELRMTVVKNLLGFTYIYNYGENIARTTATEDIGHRFMRMWAASEGHYLNMTDSNWKHMGVGMAQDSIGRWYGVQIFSD